MLARLQAQSALPQSLQALEALARAQGIDEFVADVLGENNRMLQVFGSSGLAVTRDGGVPGIGPLLVRNVFRLIDSLPALYGLGLTLVVLTREKVRCGDMAAGTLLVYEQTAPALAVAAQHASASIGTLDAAGAELVAELLARWPTLVPGLPATGAAAASFALNLILSALTVALFAFARKRVYYSGGEA